MAETRFVLITVPSESDPETWATLNFQKYNFDYEPWQTTATTILAWSGPGDDPDDVADQKLIEALKADGIKAEFVTRQNEDVWPTLACGQQECC